MTIDEIITHQRELEEDFRSYKTTNKESAFKKQCEKQAKECEQIAEWLEELKAYKEKEFDVLKQDGQLLYKNGVIDGYNKAIDDVIEKINNEWNFFLPAGIKNLIETLKKQES